MLLTYFADMSNPCMTCTSRKTRCTFDEARKPRGPVPGRIGKMQRQQRSKTQSGESILDFRSGGSRALSNASTAFSPISIEDDCMLERVSTMPALGSTVAHLEDPPGSSYWRDISNDAQAEASGMDAQSGLVSTTSTQNEYLNGINTVHVPPNPSTPAFLLPSLPVESPSDDTYHMFSDMPEQDVSINEVPVDFWPKYISQEALLPWIDVYFRRLHPTVPVLNRTMIYQDMLMRKHHHDPQYGAMLLALCAFAMTQPVQIHEVSSTPSRSVQARMLLEESIKMRMTVDFGEQPTVHMILASFFIFACLFGYGLHKAARHRLREAVDLANALSMHRPQVYDSVDEEARDQWLRTYLVLSVTERAYALQRLHPISFRGSTAVNAYFMRSFGAGGTPNSSRNNDDTIGMTGLLYLMETFDAIDESVIDCWAGYCKYSDGCCETFDRRRALQMFRAQRRARGGCLTGSISFEPSASLPPLEQLLESQQADISVTQFWLLNRLWNLCMSHGLLREVSEHAGLRFDFAYHVAIGLLSVCNKLSLPAMEVHGVGLAEKLYDIALGLAVAAGSSTLLSMDTELSSADVMLESDLFAAHLSVGEALRRLDGLLRSFRGGEHEYVDKFSLALDAVPGFHPAIA
jgi:hypothetical protein